MHRSHISAHLIISADSNNSDVVHYIPPYENINIVVMVIVIESVWM